ncbi:MAG: SEC-C domain-containing protein, partial [Lentisphaeria bacterium]|nr:SEC-C domain-containing protein [Lentisphaeria bacterium]
MAFVNREVAADSSEDHHGHQELSVGRNDRCPCGSGSKYKKCCLLRKRREATSSLPSWVIDSNRKLHQFEKYATKVYALPRLLGSLSDGRRDPTYPTLDVVGALFHAALLRRPSINATEGDLKQSDFQKLIGLKPDPGQKAFSAEVISNVLDKLDLDGLRNGIENIIWQAERNKVFREGSYGTLRCVALDGWEPFCSYDRHCDHCLAREVSVKNAKTGEVEKRTQYYHRYVVAMLVDPVMDVVLDIEPVLNAEARRDLGEDAHHEGELTAAHRLIDRLHTTYGTFIDALVLDALYANGPIMTRLDTCGYGGFIVLKKDNNEPLKEALALWGNQGPCE